MPQNEFKPFAIASSAAVLEQSEYEMSQVLREGFKKGLARSVEVNKAIRQASSIAAVVAEFAAEKSGKDMLDNGDVGILKENFETALSAVSSLLIAEALGTGDLLSASFTPKLRELKNGTLVHVRAKEKNLTKIPVFKADETGEKVIVKGNNLSLEEGDIAGAGHWLELQYDEALDKWVLQNPAKGITPSSGVPVGTIEYFAMVTSPAGYLKANGAAVGRETYPELYATIGTTFGEGDGSSTFNLPDLIDRFAQGSNTPGQKIEAGLSDHNHTLPLALEETGTGYAAHGSNISSGTTVGYASASNPIYGASNTVQPPALTLLPCIKAFDAATNPGLIDITGLAREMANKTDAAAAAHAAMPSNVYEELGVPEGTLYDGINYQSELLTMPADGYLFWYQLFKSNGTDYFTCWMGFYRFKDGVITLGNSDSIVGAGSNQWIEMYMPVSKGDQVRLLWGPSRKTEDETGLTSLKFIYANGSAPKERQ
ncbi:tail fiber protein [Oxalobacter formigenes]|uniref:tail fiber protein n=1 Tax=Oxalobacter formigenes TaxID=847 RepID=UPI0003171748|nr:tail fiber protein [Oxalobacter formigenes]ARQ45728.1 Phage Tail Collar Domain protein [Oxalobacter formigenes]ARQ77965.1 hypothetical protein BRW84_04545 [Oxalobacter formigenes OXCC13]MCZ4063126.1 phage tail protein [Oxalobacter formigenes]QDX33486.1 tail fiber protein [Oxalobacter formigenes]WAW02373.1 phage tail protein [Oxalobacter formigenes]